MLTDGDSENFTWKPIRESGYGRFSHVLVFAFMASACLGAGFVVGRLSVPEPREAHPAAANQAVLLTKDGISRSSSTPAAPGTSPAGEPAGEAKSVSNPASEDAKSTSSENQDREQAHVVLLNPGAAESASTQAGVPARTEKLAAQADRSPPPAKSPRRQTQPLPRFSLDERVSQRPAVGPVRDYRGLRDLMLGR